ncbi:S-layer homology domain-containing protein [Paenibacillus daejeonensis]|uniref:S-layer homology domain-containing protein n=1 Tax=Paenibacillus daejeonensis TaxID=135193 RepID=UPI000360CE6A|nr:S-layer homology domain-containing protein [Paenibacillus daejeonensis]
MKRWIASLLVLSLMIVLLPTRGYAAELTLQTPAVVTAGQNLTLSGTAPSAEVILSIRSLDGEIVFFDTQKVADGAYRVTISVPQAWAGSSYNVVAVSGGQEVSNAVAVRNSGGPDTGTPGGPPTGLPGGNNGEEPGTTRPPAGGSDPVVTPGSRGVTVTVTPVEVNGRMTVTLSSERLAPVLEALRENGAQSRQLVIRLSGGTTTGTAYDLQLSPEAAALLWGSTATSIVLASPLGSVAYDQKSLETLASRGAGEVRFEIEAVDPFSLTATGRNATGGRPVVDVQVSVGGTNVTAFDGGTVRLGIPYELAGSEDSQAVVVYYLPGAGSPAVVRNGWYDEAAGMMYVTLTHFSMYGIGVQHVTFGDVSGWSVPYITYLSARGIIEGVGAGEFAPAKPVTRGEFVAILARLSEAEASAYESGLFTDVQASDWYAPYVQWGYDSGVVQGTGQGRFQPREPISRQELAVMVSRYAETMGYTLPADQAAVSFADRSQFGEWAVAAIGKLQQAGIIEGIGDGRFNPRGTATRAEASKMIAVLLQGLSQP